MGGDGKACEGGQKQDDRRGERDGGGSHEVAEAFVVIRAGGFAHLDRVEGERALDAEERGFRVAERWGERSGPHKRLVIEQGE